LINLFEIVQGPVVTTDLQVDVECVSEGNFVFSCRRLVLKADELDTLFVNFFNTLKSVENVVLRVVFIGILAYRIVNIV